MLLPVPLYLRVNAKYVEWPSHWEIGMKISTTWAKRKPCNNKIYNSFIMKTLSLWQRLSFTLALLFKLRLLISKWHLFVRESLQVIGNNFATVRISKLKTTQRWIDREEYTKIVLFNTIALSLKPHFITLIVSLVNLLKLLEIGSFVIVVTNCITVGIWF